MMSQPPLPSSMVAAASSVVKGNAFLLLLLSLICSFARAMEVPLPTILDHQEDQLHCLETLVESLSKIVFALEYSLSICTSLRSDNPLPPSLEPHPSLVTQPLLLFSSFREVPPSIGPCCPKLPIITVLPICLLPLNEPPSSSPS